MAKTIHRFDGQSNLINFTPGILIAILPCLAIQSTPEGSVSSSRQFDNQSRLNVTLNSHHRFIPQSLNRGNICEISSLVNSLLLEQITIVLDERKNTLGKDTTSHDLEPILEVLVKKLEKQEHPVVKLAVLEWLKRLKKSESELILATNLQKKLYQTLLETLSARSDAVVKNALRVMTDLFCFDQFNSDESTNQSQTLTSSTDPAANEESSKAKDDESSVSNLEKRKSQIRTNLSSPRRPGAVSGKKVAIATSDDAAAATASTVSANQQQSNANVTKFIQALCNMFRDHESVFEERATFIVINLCTMMRPDVIYRSFAEILKEEKTENSKFAYNLVQKLNQILLTTQPLFGLRSRLSSSDEDPEMKALFSILYNAWSHSPIAVLTLCLLTNNHKHASEVVVTLSKSDITVDILTQIDWVVQLIETPVFASLRMKLLDVDNNQFLLQSLYGLLMILPQSEAYKKLSNRLDQAHKFISSQSSFK